MFISVNCYYPLNITSQHDQQTSASRYRGQLKQRLRTFQLSASCENKTNFKIFCSLTGHKLTLCSGKIFTLLIFINKTTQRMTMSDRPQARAKTDLYLRNLIVDPAITKQPLKTFPFRIAACHNVKRNDVNWWNCSSINFQLWSWYFFMLIMFEWCSRRRFSFAKLNFL